MMKTVEERKKEGKAYRKVTSRSTLGEWKVETGRPIVEELIRKQEETRLQPLISLRHERMAVSPFTFFRGAAILQAADLARTPGTYFVVQACGDAHISNFGIFASPERRIVFDINDFDETLPAPFEVDITRLLASVEICGRQRGFSKSKRQEAVSQAASLYRETMMEFSELGNMEVWYKHLDLESLMEKDPHFADKEQTEVLREVIGKAITKNSDKAVRKLTETVDGKLRIRSAPPLIVPIRDMPGKEKELYDFRHNLIRAIQVYRKSLSTDRRRLLDQYVPVELAHKVVGVGSVGLQAWMMVLMGRENADPLVLQIKQAQHSVLEEYYGASKYALCGQRVVEGQRMIQTAGDILLGWVRLEETEGKSCDYYVRQLWDAKGSFDLEKISERGYLGLSLLCAWTLAHAHAKTGDRHMIAGYLGKSDSFDRAMVRYAELYADQNEADYEMFLKYCGIKGQQEQSDENP